LLCYDSTDYDCNANKLERKKGKMCVEKKSGLEYSSKRSVMIVNYDKPGE